MGTGGGGRLAGRPSAPQRPPTQSGYSSGPPMPTKPATSWSTKPSSTRAPPGPRGHRQQVGHDRTRVPEQVAPATLAVLPGRPPGDPGEHQAQQRQAIAGSAAEAARRARKPPLAANAGPTRPARSRPPRRAGRQGAADHVHLRRLQRAGRGAARNKTSCRNRVTPAEKHSRPARPARSSAPAGAKTRPASTSVAATLLSGSSRGNHSGSSRDRS